MSESVLNTETSGTALTTEHSSLHFVAEWGVSGFNGQANKDLTFELSSWTPVPDRVSIAPTPSAFGETRQGNCVWESVYSARLCAADYGHYERQTLTHI